MPSSFRASSQLASYSQLQYLSFFTFFQKLFDQHAPSHPSNESALVKSHNGHASIPLTIFSDVVFAIAEFQCEIHLLT